MIIKLDRAYEVKCSLGTIRDIESAYDKSFFELVNDITKMKTEEQIKLLYIGAKKADNTLILKEFTDKCEEYMGLGDLMDYLEKYFYGLQYPGLSDEEVQNRIEKKLQKSRELQRNRDLIG
ncbi:MAG: hypothetical protein LBQ27_00560 [Clostridiales bacterium]|jgi:hypothetical protein|nr:hypothetical protein [Clostridiales bacterium]